MNKSVANRNIKILMRKADLYSNGIINGRTAELIRAYREALDYVSKELSRLYEKVEAGKELTELTVQQFKRLSNLQHYCENTLIDLGKTHISLTSESIAKNYLYNYKAIPKVLSESVSELKSVFGMVNNSVVEKLATAKLDKIDWKGLSGKNVTEANQEIRRILSTNNITGKSYKQMADEMKNTLDISAGKAVRITRTESHRAIQEARTESYRDVSESADRIGIKIAKVWISTDGPNHRHGFMNNVLADENGMFDFHGMSVEGPGMTGDPSEDINCMCTTGIQIV